MWLGMIRLANGSRIGGVLLLVLFCLSSVSLSAGDAEAELIQILRSYEQITKNLENKFESYEAQLTGLDRSMESAEMNLKNLKSISQKQSELLQSFDQNLSEAETTLENSEKRIDGLESTLSDMERDLGRSRAFNKYLAGGLAVSLLLAGLSLLL